MQEWCARTTRRQAQCFVRCKRRLADGKVSLAAFANASSRTRTSLSLPICCFVCCRSITLDFEYRCCQGWLMKKQLCWGPLFFVVIIKIPPITICTFKVQLKKSQCLRLSPFQIVPHFFQIQRDQVECALDSLFVLFILFPFFVYQSKTWFTRKFMLNRVFFYLGIFQIAMFFG